MRQDESFSACLEMLQLENSDYTQLPAHYRLMWSIVAAAIKQNTINTSIAKKELLQKKEASKDVNKATQTEPCVDEPTKDTVYDINLVIPFFVTFEIEK